MSICNAQIPIFNCGSKRLGAGRALELVLRVSEDIHLTPVPHPNVHITRVCWQDAPRCCDAVPSPSPVRVNSHAAASRLVVVVVRATAAGGTQSSLVWAPARPSSCSSRVLWPTTRRCCCANSRGTQHLTSAWDPRLTRALDMCAHRATVAPCHRFVLREDTGVPSWCWHVHCLKALRTVWREP